MKNVFGCNWNICEVHLISPGYAIRALYEYWGFGFGTPQCLSENSKCTKDRRFASVVWSYENIEVL